MSGVVYLLAGSPGDRIRGADPAMRAFFDEVRAKKPHVAYIGTASGDDRGFFEALRARLVSSGAGEVDLAPLSGAAANPAVARRLLARADAVFVSGGDVAEGMGGLRAHPGIVTCLRQRFAAGVPFMGLSAGSIMLARGWVSWGDGAEKPDAVLECLGFAPLYCDVHGEEDGWDELKTLLRLLPRNAVGYGIRAGGALRVSEGVAEAIPAFDRRRRIG